MTTDKLLTIAKIVDRTQLKYLGYDYNNSPTFMKGNQCVVVDDSGNIETLTQKQQLQLKPSKITISMVKDKVNQLIHGE